MAINTECQGKAVKGSLSTVIYALREWGITSCAPFIMTLYHPWPFPYLFIMPFVALLLVASLTVTLTCMSLVSSMCPSLRCDVLLLSSTMSY